MALRTITPQIADLLADCVERLDSASDVDIVIGRLDSILHIITTNNLFDLQPWRNVLELLQHALESLLLYMDSCQCQNIGRPRLPVPFGSLEYLLSLKFSATRIAEMLGISRRTLHRRMLEAGLSVRSTYSEIGNNELHSVVLDVLLNHPNTGYKRMKGYLLERGHKITDIRVRWAMRTVDPIGVQQRSDQNRAIVRRIYYVDYSNQLWHLDTNMKLIRWGVVIRGCIDGKSRTAIYLDVSGDNRADTNLGAFLCGVQQYGVPLRTRSDKGGENVLIARYMIETRGVGRASHICGKSVHNQRIERFWKDVSYGTTRLYYNVFNWLENNAILNIDNPKHMAMLHKVFIPRIKRSLQIFKAGWNNHPISTERNFTPRQLMIMHLPPPEVDIQINQDELHAIDFLCNSVTDLVQFNEDEEDGIVYPIIQEALSVAEHTRFGQIDVLADSHSYGCDIFARALECLD